jgi:hypothetical protein
VIGEGDEPQTWWVSRRTGEVLRAAIPPGEQRMAEREAVELPSRR